MLRLRLDIPGLPIFALAGSLLLLFAQASGAEPFAYISNALDDTVSVIDTATDTVAVGSIPVAVAIHGSTC